MTVRLSGLVAAMTTHSRRLWRELDVGLRSETTRRQWAALAARRQREVDALCAREGGHPAQLETRSLQAYGWFAFLASPETLQGHLEALHAARTAVRRHAAPGTADGEIHLLGMSSLWRAQRTPRGSVHRFHESFVAAPVELWNALFQAFAAGRTDVVRALVRDFGSGDDAAEVVAEMDSHAGEDEEAAAGETHDLEAAFARVNARCFDGAMERPQLAWTRRPTVRVFGHYNFARDRVTLSRSLDHPEVPTLLVDYILYHELLHKRHGLTPRSGRLFAHTPAFRADERRFEGYAEAEQAMRALARRLRRRRR
jgi:hypothetical protein